MAVKKLTPVQAGFNKITKIAGESASSASDGFQLEIPEADELLFLIAENTHDSTAYKVTVKAPTKQGYASTDEDLELQLAAGEKAVIRVESARYANTDGTIDIAVGNTAVKVVAVY
jgi:hypothetical protein